MFACCLSANELRVAQTVVEGRPSRLILEQLIPGSQQTSEGNAGDTVAAGPLTSTSPVDDLCYSELQGTPGGPGVKDGWVYRRPSAADGTVASAQTIANFSQPPEAIALAHLSSQINDDLVTSDPPDGLSVQPGNGDGTFRSPVAISSVTSSQGVTTADLNGDGRQDVAVGAPGGAASMAVLMNASPLG